MADRIYIRKAEGGAIQLVAMTEYNPPNKLSTELLEAELRDLDIPDLVNRAKNSWKMELAISAILDSQPSLGRGWASHPNCMINKTAPGELLGQSIHSSSKKIPSISIHFNKNSSDKETEYIENSETTIATIIT